MPCDTTPNSVSQLRPTAVGRSSGWTIARRSYWIPGSYAPALSEKRNSFLRLLKNKGFKKESRTKVGVYAISKSTTLESNKSLAQSPPQQARAHLPSEASEVPHPL